jgi:hypothetical protein
MTRLKQRRKDGLPIEVLIDGVVFFMFVYKVVFALGVVPAFA